MSNTLLLLTRYYSNVMRVESARISAADQARLTTLAGQVDAGTTTYADAQQSVGALAINTTSVANLAYNFFTGATPTSGGLDYLVSPTGANPNNLNAPYYQNFNLENRYINFAVNLGKLGEGQTKFAAEYGSLTLEQSVIKAYREIFGVDKAGIEGILTADVGGQTRADYFAYYGKDGLTGIGTKAAMVGWLLAEAAKADTGTYARAEKAFLTDLGPDGLAVFNTNIGTTYGDAPAGTAGATIAFAQTQSVTLTAADTALKSTDNNDSITGTALDAGQSVVAGAGNDSLTITGAVGGVIDAGAGNDTVTIGTLSPPAPILGGAETGVIRLGAGNDVLTITDAFSFGAVVDGGAGDDTLIAKFGPSALNPPVIRNIEHLVVTGMGSIGQALFFETAAFQDVTVRYTGAFNMVVGEHVALKMQNIANGAGVNANYIFAVQGQLIQPANGGRPVASYADYADLTLDNVSITGNFSTNFVTVSGVNKGLRVHVQTDSTIGTLNWAGDPAQSGALPTLFIDGPGKLAFGTAYGGAHVIDASRAAAVNVTYFGGAKATLSAGNDSILINLGRTGMTDVTLGAGSDTYALYQEFNTFLNQPENTFHNLVLSGQLVTGYARILDFAKGVDHVDLGTYTTSVTTGLNIGTASTLEQALINISPSVAAGGTGVFEFGGDTYIYRQDSTIGVNGSLGTGPTTGDGLIKLVGVTGLTVGTGAGNVDIHYG